MKSRNFLVAAAAAAGCGLLVSQLLAGGAKAPTADETSIMQELVAGVEADPTDGRTRLRLASILLQQGNLAEAHRLIAEVEQIDPVLHENFTAPRISPSEAGLRGGLSAGPDVVYSSIFSPSSHGAVGGINAYSIGSDTCNVGNQNLIWANNGTPGFGTNVYRLHNGRLVQIGQSWVKHACCAFQANGCGLGCSSGSGLGPGCLDSYSAGWNSGQGRLGPRSGINAFTGQFSSLPGGSGNAIFRRTQVKQVDMNPATYPGALYFVEGVYVATDDAQNQNWLNNASYRRITFNASFQMSVVDSTRATVPAIHAWRDYGLGVGMPADTSVDIVNVDIPNEGRFIAGSKAIDNGDGTWRYEYAVYNLNSDRSGGSFSVPVPAGVNVTNVGFNDVDYHSGEPYDNTDWNANVGGGAITWSSPQTFAQNANSNAIRWGTMYSFWFTADAAPADVNAALGLFKPHNPGSVAFTVTGPGVPPCPADLDGDGVVGANDLAIMLGSWGGPGADLDNDGVTGASDLALLLGSWGACS